MNVLFLIGGRGLFGLSLISCRNHKYLCLLQLSRVLEVPLLKCNFSEPLHCHRRRKHRRATLSLLVNLQFAIVVTVSERIPCWAHRSLSGRPCNRWLVWRNFRLLYVHGVESVSVADGV